MSIELGSAEAVVRDQAARSGLSPEQYVLRLALEDSVRRHAAWQAEHPDLVEAAAREAELAQAELSQPVAAGLAPAASAVTVRLAARTE